MNYDELKAVLDDCNLEKKGIVDWGVTSEAIPISLKKYNSWVEKGWNGHLKYLEGDRQIMREDLRNYFPKFETSIVFLFSYSKTKYLLNSFYNNPSLSNGLKIAGYALGFDGVDYHDLLKEYLSEISNKLSLKIPSLKTALSYDIQPVLERDMAVRAGLGWFGKNSMFIHKSEGSFLILGSLLISEKITNSKTKIETDHCGQCTKCIEACPTQAISSNDRIINTNKCISTWTIEYFKDWPEAPTGMENGSGEIFGCDICQDVCPWNKRIFRKKGELKTAPKFSEKNSELINFFLNRTKEEIIDDLENMSNGAFRRKFHKTPLERTGRKSLLKSILYYLNK
jgi:epoxyqueuosine reductase